MIKLAMTCLKLRKEEGNVYLNRGEVGRGGKEEGGSKLLSSSIPVPSVERSTQNAATGSALTEAAFLLLQVVYSAEGEAKDHPGLSSSYTEQPHRSDFFRNLIQKL